MTPSRATFNASRQGATPYRFEAFQAVRGLASLTVVIRHVLACYPLPGHGLTVAVFFLFNSPAAVTLFFVLSGFVLTYSLDNRPFEPRTIPAFWVRRVFRILPALMVATLLSALYTRLPVSAWPIATSDPFMAGILPHNMPLPASTLLKCLLSLSSVLVPQGWTVMVELIAALFIPFIWLCSRKDGRFFLPIALATLALSAFAPAGGKGLPLLYSFSFIAGITACRAWQTSTIRLTGGGIVLAAIGLSLPTTLLTSPETLGEFFNSPKLVIPESICAAFLIFGLARPSKITAALTARPLLWLGDISFSLYLVHFLIIALAGRILSPLLPNVSVYTREGLVLALTLLIALPLSHLLFQWVERPLNRLGHRLSKRG
ncbi:acyltransferase family protein [Acetobacter fallax]|uniref:Acyltransferase family protein n=1 Tax=Acetobacter fallax TaxID=1737473 RepID=A0ABX0KF47_9PROT|nr:acyltransferase [Acetobacter fallax]NHO32552.1 acyltransferase family protein [Acetobacter fallax]NHO36103.1 acyltransferase family protein [Acetobacter fallax]